MGRGLELDPADGAFIKRVDAFTDPHGLYLVTPECSSSAAHAIVGSRLRQVPAQAGGAGG